MKYCIFTKLGEESEKLKKEFCGIFNDNGFVLEENKPEVVFVVGGDGTVLRAYKKFFNIIDSVKFVVIHDGTLGYFADFEKSEINDIINSIKNNKLRDVKRSLVEMEIVSKNGKKSVLTALNEVRIEAIKSALIADVFVNDVKLETYRGNGFCVSSPSGSTAYNKSLGGAIIQNTLKVFELTEIASINHNKYHCLNSSLVLSSESKVKIVPIPNSEFYIGADTDFFDGVNVWLDGEGDDIAEINCGLSFKCATFLIPPGNYFVARLNRCFIIN